jgi:lipopolysaccharide transport system ATP-binding protein
MSSELAIRAEGLGKCYQIYASPRDRLLQMLVRGRRRYYREFWALRDVSFEVARGETVGIVGRNGSGKSTLLQMVCGTLNPTSGSVTTNGRIAALLELGAGFNPEFTGRENVHMASSLYGLSREQVDARFDRIAGFADIGDFMEQPVKTYSSGMYVRLAFAVIAHVDADILVVDEALAVGDAVFTQRCMRFIHRFQQDGTLLFVSHDMGAVQRLCRSAMWLSHGRLVGRGASKRVAEAYLQDTQQALVGTDTRLEALRRGSEAGPGGDAADEVAPVVEAVDYGGEDDGAEAPAAIDYAASAEVRGNLPEARGWATGQAEITGVSLERDDGSAVPVLEGGERVRMVLSARAAIPLARPILGFIVKDRLGQDLFGENTLPFTDASPVSVEAGESFQAVFEFRLPMLPNGQYAVMASVADGSLTDNVQHHYLHDALILTVASSRVRWGLVGIPFENVRLARTP